MSTTYRRSLLRVDGRSSDDQRRLQEWSELARETDAPPYLRPGWFVAWARAFAKGELELHGVWRDSMLVAAVPLIRHAYGRTSATNVHSAQFDPVAREPDDARQLLQAIAGRQRPVLLSLVWPDTAALVVDAAESAGREVARWPQHASPGIDTDRPLAGYLAERDQRWLRQLDRRRRRLEKKGELTLEVSDGSDGVDELLSSGLDLEASGWKGESGTAIRSHPETEQFYGEVARWGATDGVLRLAALRLDGRLIGFDYCLENRATHYFIKTGYDEKLRSEAPGMILRRMMVERAFHSSLRRYELLGSDEAWKMRWADHVNDVQRVLITPSTLLGRLARVGYGTARAGGKSLRRQVKRLRERP